MKCRSIIYIIKFIDDFTLLNRKNFTLFWMVLSIVLIALLITILYNRKYDLNSSSPEYSSVTLDVASKFYCLCGSCAKLSLEICGGKNFKEGIEKLRELQSELL